MCNFMSGIFFRNGDIVSASEYTDSHEILKRAAKAERASLVGHLAELEPVQWEYTPPKDLKWAEDLSKWTLTVDQSTVHSWWDANKVREWCERRVKAMFITEERGTLLGGCWICIGNKAMIKELIGGKLAITVGSNFEGSNFVNSHFMYSRFEGSLFVGSRFEGSRFVGSRFVDSNFAGSNFECSNFAGSYADVGTILPAGWNRAESGLIMHVG